MADNILDFQAGRDAAIDCLTRDARRSKDWLEGYDQVDMARKAADANQ